jgi:hypothetical protein
MNPILKVTFGKQDARLKKKGEDVEKLVIKTDNWQEEKSAETLNV